MFFSFSTLSPWHLIVVVIVMVMPMWCLDFTNLIGAFSKKFELVLTTTADFLLLPILLSIFLPVMITWPDQVLDWFSKSGNPASKPKVESTRFLGGFKRYQPTRGFLLEGVLNRGMQKSNLNGNGVLITSKSYILYAWIYHLWLYYQKCHFHFSIIPYFYKFQNHHHHIFSQQS